MNRREMLKAIAVLGAPVPAAVLAAGTPPMVVDHAMGTIDRHDWWVPMLTAWKSGRAAPELEAFCDALAVPDRIDIPRIDVAVARLLLGDIQNYLPARSMLIEDSWVTTRPSFPRSPGNLPRFRPTLCIDVNWATSGPGSDWLESWYVTTIPELSIHVVTVSRDSEDAFGCADHAIGWRPTSVDHRTASRELILADWRWRRKQLDQAQWDASRCGAVRLDDVIGEMVAQVYG
jgi:hypothetical protein